MVLTVPKDFEDHFSQVYGSRWPEILEALRSKEKQVLFAPFLAGEEHEIEWLPSCWWLGEGREDWPQSRSSEGLLKYYVLDPASVLVARALGVNPGDRVLDMCAAPGGKSLVLAQTIGQDGTLDLNEISAPRRNRLTKVVQQYIPRHLREGIFVKGKDGLRFGLVAKETYDRILIDAPCSGERHLLENNVELSRWKKKRVTSLAQKQYSLLASGLGALKPGGRLVYSTCALSPEENDGVIAKAIKKKKGLFEVCRLEAPSPWAEKTEFGWIHLPDKCEFGPLYFSVVEKNS